MDGLIICESMFSKAGELGRGMVVALYIFRVKDYFFYYLRQTLQTIFHFFTGGDTY